MNSGELIREALQRALDGGLAVYDEDSGQCLQALRNVLMDALGLSKEQFWERYAFDLADDHPTPITAYWARDVMVTLRALGKRVAYDTDRPLVLDYLEAGDLLFSWRLGRPAGHCGVLLSGGKNALMFENTSTLRGVQVSGYNRLSRVDSLPYPSSWEAFRL